MRLDSVLLGDEEKNNSWFGLFMAASNMMSGIIYIYIHIGV